MKMYLRDVIAAPLQHHLENNSNYSSVSSLASPPGDHPLYRNAIAQTSLGISHSKNFSSSSSMQDRVNLQRSFGDKNVYNAVSPFTEATSSSKKRKSPPSSLNFRAYNNDLSKGYLRRSIQRSSCSSSFSRADSIEDVDEEDAPMRTPKRKLMDLASPPKNPDQQDLRLECLRRMRKGDATTKQAAVLLYKILTGTASAHDVSTDTSDAIQYALSEAKGASYTLTDTVDSLLSFLI
jgi:hypothetical protein